MMRTQIQLPDALYARAKQIARQHEISLAELVRRGLEHMVRLYPPSEKPPDGWTLPAPLSLGDFMTQPVDWRELANPAPRRPADTT
ncbi:MAG: CopG family transcriptional regulator [Acidobacteriota bacterium]